MKKYFTKYLPVEGEIKEGEYGLTSKGIVFKALPTHMDLAKGKQKVKLFLCNRDIQVGDEFNNSEILNKKYIADVVNENDIECYKHDCYVPKRYCFKVIGEISPDALSYVIEGMEFDENQIKEVSYNRSIGDIKEWVERFIQIKGPCGHFH